MYWIFACIITLLTLSVKAGNILFIPSMVSPSHKIGMVLWADALAEKGHNVLFWSPLVINDKYVPKKAKWKQIFTKSDDEYFNSAFVFQNATWVHDMIWTTERNVPGMESAMTYMVLPYCEQLLSEQKREIDAVLSHKWDIIILDELFNPCGYLVSLLSGAPVGIFVSTSRLTRHATYRNGQPVPLSYVPAFGNVQGFLDNMNFFDRVSNVWQWIIGCAVDDVSYMLSTRRLARLYPDITDITLPAQHPAMVFAYFPSLLNYPNPTVPNLAFIGPLHAHKKNDTDLPSEILKMIDSPTEKRLGFLIVAMGHWAKYEYAPKEIRDAFLKMMNRIADEKRYLVIFQLSSDPPPGLSSKVKVMKWLPQRALLAHPKCKVFISHCGCNSLLEAVTYGVPIVGIPLFADQAGGVALAFKIGAGIRLRKTDLSPELFYETVQHVLQNDSFSTNAKKFSSLLKDQPTTEMERAVFWTEFVIRHKRKTFRLHVRTPSTFFSGIKYFCIDVIVVLSAILTVVCSFLFCVILTLWRLVAGDRATKRRQ